MKKIKYILIVSFLLISTYSFAGVDFGADVVSRYIWRGMDFGNSVSVQPFLSASVGGFEAGAWASYPFSNDAIGANENDLYVSYSVGPVSFLVTDYYYPEGLKFGDYSDDGSHVIEGAVSASIGPVGLIGAVNAYGDNDHSIYFEATYEFYSKDDLSVGTTLGAGNKAYISDPSGDPNIVVLGISASKGNLSASYIINPEMDTNYLVFGYSIGL
jgi:hypothetical protein